MDIRAIISWTLKHWWWFLISVALCVIVAGAVFYTSSYKYSVRATLMLRHVSESSDGPDELMQLMGFRDNKVAGDEVKVLSSRDLMGRVVDELDLTTSYYKLHHGKVMEQFPNHDLTVVFPDTTYCMVTVEVKVKEGGYKIKVKPYNEMAEYFRVSDLSASLDSKLGPIYVSIPKSVKKGHYRAVFLPRIAKVDQLIKQIVIARLSRESNVITLSTTTDSPNRMAATINTLINFYNQEGTSDKNIVALQTELFLNERIPIVEQELNDIEAALESYKSHQQIADLEYTANKYQEFGDDYEQQIAELDASIRLLDYVSEQIKNSASEYTMLPAVSNSDVVNAYIKDYNQHVAYRDELLQTATEQNMVVVKENELLKQKKQNISEALVQDRSSLQLRRNELLNQQHQYNSRLASIPETERRYLEMKRAKEAKEKQYIFLIEKREENSMMLASDAVPARVVDSAQRDPAPVAPNAKKMMMVAVFFGLLFPYIIYFFGIFRKEYL